MPRQTRSRVAESRRGEPSSDSAPTTAPIAKANHTDIRSDETDIYGVSDRERERQRKVKDANKANNERTTPAATTRTTRSAVAPSNTIDADDSPVLELGRKDIASSIDSSLLGPRRGNLSGLEIHDDEIFGNLDSSFGDDTTRAAGEKESISGSGVASGTKSADTSTFNVSVFRRQNPVTRRRQSSVASRDDAPIRPSSRGPTTPGLSTTFSMGNFRRRQRQPSILMSSAQKNGLGLTQQRGSSRAVSREESENAVESEVEEDSFLPEAEGTPVRASRGRRDTMEDPMEEIVAQGQREARSKKRKSTEAHDGGEAAKRQALDNDQDSIHLSIEEDEQSSPPSFIERRRREPEVDEAILAPPVSDSEGSPSVWPSLKELGKRTHTRAPVHTRKTPAMDEDESELSSPPSLTHSPNLKPAKPVAKAKPKSSPKLSTADLEALLPRRRKKVPRNEYDMDDGESNASETERRRPSRATKKKQQPTRPVNGSSSRAHQAPAKRSSTRRTYGSRSFNKETSVEGDTGEATGDGSTPLDDTAFSVDAEGETTTTLGLPDELQAASRKFKEVDKWELDFEEVVEPSSDLPEGR